MRVGYKEFSQYLSTDQSEKLLEDALEEMKRSTRKYAQRQIKWIKNKTLPAIDATKKIPRGEEDCTEQDHMYLLDATGMAPSL